MLHKQVQQLRKNKKINKDNESLQVSSTSSCLGKMEEESLFASAQGRRHFEAAGITHLLLLGQMNEVHTSVIPTGYPRCCLYQQTTSSTPLLLSTTTTKLAHLMRSLQHTLFDNMTSLQVSGERAIALIPIIHSAFHRLSWQVQIRIESARYDREQSKHYIWLQNPLQKTPLWSCDAAYHRLRWVDLQSAYEITVSMGALTLACHHNQMLVVSKDLYCQGKKKKHVQKVLCELWPTCPFLNENISTKSSPCL